MSVLISHISYVQIQVRIGERGEWSLYECGVDWKEGHLSRLVLFCFVVSICCYGRMLCADGLSIHALVRTNSSLTAKVDSGGYQQLPDTEAHARRTNRTMGRPAHVLGFRHIQIVFETRGDEWL